MPIRRKRHKVPQSAAQMFALVADVERYPEFLPGCRALTVTSRETLADDTEIITADMLVGYKMFEEMFRSRVTVNRSALSIDIHYLQGPFRHLDNNWRFRDLDQGGSEIDFYISFELRSRGLGLLVGGLFEHVFVRMIDAFESRARIIYPPSITAS